MSPLSRDHGPRPTQLWNDKPGPGHSLRTVCRDIMTHHILLHLQPDLEGNKEFCSFNRGQAFGPLSIVHCLPLSQRATFWRVSNHNRFVLCMMMIWYCNQGIGHWAESIHCVCVMMIIASVFRTDCQILAPPPHWPPSGLGQWGPEDRVVTEITMGYLLGRIQIMVDTLSMVQKLQEVFLWPTTLLTTFRRHTLYYKMPKGSLH